MKSGTVKSKIIVSESSDILKYFAIRSSRKKPLILPKNNPIEYKKVLLESKPSNKYNLFFNN